MDKPEILEIILQQVRYQIRSSFSPSPETDPWNGSIYSFLCALSLHARWCQENGIMLLVAYCSDTSLPASSVSWTRSDALH